MTLMKKSLPYILIALLILGLTACGKKGPPVPPDDEPPSVTLDPTG